MEYQRDESLQRLLERQRNDWSLDQPFYNDPDIFERDAQRLRVCRKISGRRPGRKLGAGLRDETRRAVPH